MKSRLNLLVLLFGLSLLNASNAESPRGNISQLSGQLLYTANNEVPPPGNPDDAPPPGNPDDAPPGNPDDAPPPGNPDDAPPGNPDDAPTPP